MTPVRGWGVMNAVGSARLSGGSPTETTPVQQPLGHFTESGSHTSKSGCNQLHWAIRKNDDVSQIHMEYPMVGPDDLFTLMNLSPAPLNTGRE